LYESHPTVFCRWMLTERTPPNPPFMYESVLISYYFLNFAENTALKFTDVAQYWLKWLAFAFCFQGAKVYISLAHYKQTYSILRDVSWKVSFYWVSQEITNFLWILKVCYSFHKHLLSYHTVNHWNSVNTCIPCSFEILIVSFHQCLAFLFMPSNKNTVHIFNSFLHFISLIFDLLQ